MTVLRNKLLERIEKIEKDYEDKKFKGFTKFEKFIYKQEDNVLFFAAFSIASFFVGIGFYPTKIFLLFFGISLILFLWAIFIMAYSQTHKLFERKLDNEIK